MSDGGRGIPLCFPSSSPMPFPASPRHGCWVHCGLETPWLLGFADERKREMKKGSGACCRTVGRGQENPGDSLMWWVWKNRWLNEAQNSAYQKMA